MRNRADSMIDRTAATRYPLLLVHGMGFRDRKNQCYWGRTAKLLERHGASVFFGGQDSNGSVEDNAKCVKRSLLAALEKTGAEKVNILAHSKGGLEARYLITRLGCADKVASLTTLATPHRGSVTVDRLMGLVPQGVIRAGCKPIDLWFGLLGDKNPDTYAAICAFRTADAERFNEETPDMPGIFYQSYGFIMKSAFSDGLMWFSNMVVGCFEGANDGLLPPRAVKWTNYRGTYTGIDSRGISHFDETDFRRRRLSDKSRGKRNEIGDIPEFYLEIVKRLKKRGL